MRLGGWLFRHRTSIPLPIAIALVFAPAQRLAHPSLFDAAGAVLVAVGELTRLWAVRHIGAISRTRSDRLGPVVSTGPFARVRNPLYIGNIALWAGFSLAAHLPLLAPVIVLVLALEYHAIVRWEEGLLESRRGEEYRTYVRRVPRWIPTTQRTQTTRRAQGAMFSWADTLYSERGTLIAIAAGYLLIWIKVKS